MQSAERNAATTTDKTSNKKSPRNKADKSNGDDGAGAPIEMAVLSDEDTPAAEPATAEDAPPETMRRDPNVYASAIWLMQLSRRHRHLFLADLEWALMPPLALKQFRLFHKEGMPVALATWAFVSEEVDARLKLGRMRLKPEEWKSGEICWLIDVVGPNGSEGGVINSLKEGPLANRTVMAIGRDPKTGKVGAFEISDADRARK